MSPSLEQLAEQVVDAAQGQQRYLLAIAGPPGSGKSTLAEALEARLIQLGESVCTVPMDGFHLDNSLLDEDGSRDRKGAPHTFDVDGLLHLLRRIQQPANSAANSTDAVRPVVVPTFDRTFDRAIAGARRVLPEHRLILVEGNYLLLRQAPWDALLPLWDGRIFINPGMDVLRTRLIQRWLDHGLNEDDATRRAEHNDLPNAEVVLNESYTEGTWHLN